MISVIIPTYNRPQHLRQAILSVLAQTHPQVEVIVVDDGSAVSLGEVAAEFASAVRFYRKDNGGVAAARNYGLERAAGECVLFLDDDDILAPTALSDLLQALQAQPGAVWATGGLIYLKQDGERMERPQRLRPQPGDIYHRMIMDNLLATPGCVLLRTNAVRRMGGFNPALRCCEDYDLWLALARDYPIGVTPRVVIEYRIQTAGLSANWQRMYERHIGVLQAHRERARPGYDEVFARALARSHRSYGDGLYIAGMGPAARRQWQQAAQHQHARELGRASRFVKSYLPKPILKSLRRLVGTPDPARAQAA